MRRMIAAVAIVASASALAVGVSIDNSEMTGTLDIHPEAAMNAAEQISEDVNKAIEGIMPDGKQD